MIIAMYNPFAKPQTAGQWLWSSLCWAVLSVGSWVLVVSLLFRSSLAEELTVPASMLAFWISYAVVLRRSVVGASSFVYSPEAHMSLLGVIGICWIVLLAVYQVVGFAFGLVASVFTWFAF
jgi:hypothetical protein